ncbi:SPL family radical SAM protein [Candidatus Galacturonibacter soehngenii]|uniref:Spore photoproduct lyase n=1 Tax=Candidatus Galacturonatibacter soehngenii TaxID=2307010 RepID=A0A7V7QJ94_9FIRM|nr:spore photoproduct lyase [Candidatus Galacturonibacter soehngenii]KAB1437511.1 spore photoproduct lyase [Candidatus Galacturonibacter soehngenii]MBA4688449.1 spore photoproduct lyase [Candidatus Galacturonibacter soehngenii]
MKPSKIYYEPEVLNYDLGKQLYKKYEELEWTPITSHNNIEELRTKENSEFEALKRLLILGIRKTHKYSENHKVSDYLVPFTSSGCSAMCLYCYLVCNYNKCSYLRIFANREEMLDKLVRFSRKSEKELTFEIGSNSDLILENTITNNLPFVIEQFIREGKGNLTFPTKFSMVDDLLPLNHQQRIIFRMSVNPSEIITNIEIGTASLTNRVEAINKMVEAGYKVGILIAPVILLENWKEQYTRLLDILNDTLSIKMKKQMFIEIIFMTYSFVHRKINTEAFPEAIDLYNQEAMVGRGIGKYCYRPEFRQVGEVFLKAEIEKRFGEGKILYFS